jgi:hypothetical protein
MVYHDVSATPAGSDRREEREPELRIPVADGLAIRGR